MYIRTNNDTRTIMTMTTARRDLILYIFFSPIRYDLDCTCKLLLLIITIYYITIIR